MCQEGRRRGLDGKSEWRPRERRSADGKENAHCNGDRSCEEGGEGGFAACLVLHQGTAFLREGQGTTEYAILVGVLVVIAIIAITLFRPKIQELWDAIAEGINNL